MEQRTIAIRVEPELHATLQLLAQLNGRPLVEEIREAIDEHIARKRSETDLTEQAEKALVAIEAESVSRKKAIQALLASKSTSSAEPKKGRKA